MVMVNTQYFVNATQKTKVTSKGNNTKRFLTIHETGMPNVPAINFAKAQFNGNTGREASWHYTVDGKSIYQSFSHETICWHAGAKLGKNSFIGFDGNKDSIGIEICQDKDFTSAVKLAAKLAAKILKDERIPIERMVQHWHWSQKNCPERIRGGKYGFTWSSFVQLVQNELVLLNTSTQEVKTVSKIFKTTADLNVRATAGASGKLLKTLPVNTILSTTISTVVSGTTWYYSPTHNGWLSGKYLSEVIEQVSPPQPQNSHSEAWEWAKREGLMDGSNPTSPLTRQQFATVLNRFYKKFMSK